MKKRKFNVNLKPIIGLLIFFAAILFVISYLINLAAKTDYFKVKNVIFLENDIPVLNRKLDFSYLLGRSLLAIDLDKEEHFISQLYPGYKKIKVFRVFPDKLCVDFINRKPIAFIKLYRYFYVDEDGVLFDVPNQDKLPELPVIAGLETKIFGAKAGKGYKIRELTVAIDIIRAIKNNKVLSNMQIKRIDALEAANCSFLIFLPVKAAVGEINNPDSLPFNSVQVRIGQNNINDKINILVSLLIQQRNAWAAISYVDLRFKEPVIKFKEKQLIGR